MQIFGRRIFKLHIKEALFILDPINYNTSTVEFIKNFNECTMKEYKDLVSPITDIVYLKPLGINIKDIPKNYDENMRFPNKINNFDEKELILEGLSSHGAHFYEEIDLKVLSGIIETLNDLKKIKMRK